MRDAQWIAPLLEQGLMRPPEIRLPRMLTRSGVQLMGARGPAP